MGIVDLHPISPNHDHVLLNYLLNECVSIFVYIAIFAHITYKVDYLPLAHSILAVLLSNGVAFGLLILLNWSLGVEPESIELLPTLVSEFIAVLIALLIGAKVGLTLKRRKFLKLNEGGSAQDNA